MNTLQERLQSFIASLDKSVLSFENQCGIAPGTVSKMTEKSRLRTLEKISKAYPNLNMNWLKTGEGEMLKNLPTVDIDRVMSDGDDAIFGDIFKIGDTSLVKKEEQKICDLEKEIEHLKNLLEERNQRIEDLQNTIMRLEKMNDYLMQK